MTDLLEEFEKVFITGGGGSPCMECGCGRMCFATESPYYEKGELDRLQEQRSLKPRRFEEFGTAQTVFGYEILGRTYVWGCPCNYAQAVQHILWKHREQILGYIEARSRSEYESHSKALAQLAAVEQRAKAQIP